MTAILIYYFAGHSIMACLGGGRKAVGLYWKNNVTPSLTALGTCSTAATLPYNMIAGKKMSLPNWTIPIMALIVTLGDPFATLVNVTGDTALGMIAARIVNGRGWLERSLEEYAQDEETVSAGSIRKLLSETPSGCISCVREGFLLSAYIFL